MTRRKLIAGLAGLAIVALIVAGLAYRRTRQLASMEGQDGPKFGSAFDPR